MAAMLDRLPRIAVNGLLQAGDPPRLSLPTTYLDAVLRAGGTPFVLPPMGGPLDVERLLDGADGLLLTGGDDFELERLGLGATHPAAVRTPTSKQDFDFELARCALEQGLPVLGICYGMQLLGLAGGGRLLQHLPEDRPGAREHAGGALHPVAVEPASKLAGVLEVGELEVLSRHHQALSTVASPWRVSGRDDEELIEAIEHTAHPFAIGVQWHPELAPEGSPHDRLFRGLVAAAGAHSARRAYAGATR
jgi:gamma-glutamyl-gamma-aminobutyrate hydrolase PuuD